jgi:hypothetical protein
MSNAFAHAGADTQAATAHPVVRRPARCDTLIASTLLVLLLAGWLVRLGDAQQWPWGLGDYITSGLSRHA